MEIILLYLDEIFKQKADLTSPIGFKLHSYESNVYVYDDLLRMDLDRFDDTKLLRSEANIVDNKSDHRDSDGETRTVHVIYDLLKKGTLDYG